MGRKYYKYINTESATSIYINEALNLIQIYLHETTFQRGVQGVRALPSSVLIKMNDI